MNKTIAGLLFLMVFFHSCSGNKMEDASQDSQTIQPIILRMNLFFSDSEKFLSFPVWFDDALIKKDKISKITRSHYFIDTEDTLDHYNISKEIPREKREYWFYPNGQIKQMDVTYFYDDQKIGATSFFYDGYIDKYGFSKPFKKENQIQFSDGEESNADFPFYIHSNVKSNKKYLKFKDSISSNYLFYMIDNHFWGALSVDSILHPGPSDIIILGKPYLPVKQYSVQNKVKETDVKEFAYRSSDKSIKQIIKKEYPFDSKRTFRFNEKGYCNGYIDSTFSGKLFLNRIVTDMSLDAKNRPIIVTHKKENQLNKTARVSIELFSYE